MLNVLKEKIELKNKEYHNDLDKDLEDFKTKEKFSTEWNICNMLISEKSVLQYYLDLCNIILNNFDENNNLNSFNKISKLLKNDHKFYYRYIWSEFKDGLFN